MVFLVQLFTFNRVSWFHVIIGTIFISSVLIVKIRSFWYKKHFGFEAAAWYWHFVDVVGYFYIFFFIIGQVYNKLKNKLSIQQYNLIVVSFIIRNKN